MSHDSHGDSVCRCCRSDLSDRHGGVSMSEARCQDCVLGIPRENPTGKAFCSCVEGREKAQECARMMALLSAAAKVGEKRGTHQPLNSHSGADLLNALSEDGWVLARASYIPGERRA